MGAGVNRSRRRESRYSSAYVPKGEWGARDGVLATRRGTGEGVQSGRQTAARSRTGIGCMR